MLKVLLVSAAIFAGATTTNAQSVNIAAVMPPWHVTTNATTKVGAALGADWYPTAAAYNALQSLVETQPKQAKRIAEAEVAFAVHYHNGATQHCWGVATSNEGLAAFATGLRCGPSLPVAIDSVTLSVKVTKFAAS